MAIASIRTLFFGGGPPAISRFVIPVVVDAVDRKSNSTKPHVGKEVIERGAPPIADLYSATTVPRVRRILGVGTPLDHSFPDHPNITSLIRYWLPLHHQRIAVVFPPKPMSTAEAMAQMRSIASAYRAPWNVHPFTAQKFVVCLTFATSMARALTTFVRTGNLVRHLATSIAGVMGPDVSASRPLSLYQNALVRVG